MAKDDEMGNAVNLQTRQVRKIVNELHQDQLICVSVRAVFYRKSLTRRVFLCIYQSSFER